MHSRSLWWFVTNWPRSPTWAASLHPRGGLPLPEFVSSPLGLVPKKAPGEVKLIHHLSHPHGSSIRDGIPTDCSTVQYASVDVHSLVSVLTFVPSETLTKFILLYPPNDHQVARIFLVLIQPIRRALSKWPFRRWFLFTPSSRGSISVCEDVDSTEE